MYVSVGFDRLVLQNDGNFAGLFAECLTDALAEYFQSVGQFLSAIFKRSRVNQLKIFGVDLSPFYTWGVGVAIEKLRKYR